LGSQPDSAAKLHVLTLIDALGIAGGGERLAMDLALRLDRTRFERSLCISRWNAARAETPAGKEALERLRQGGVRVLGIARRSSADLSAWRPLLSELRGGRVDVLHAHKFGSNVWGALLTALSGTRVFVAHEHTWSFEGQPLRRFLDRELIARQADAVVAVSREDRRRMIEVERIDPALIRFIPNGIPSPPPASGRDLRPELGIAPDELVVGTVCALRPQKALDVMLEAVAALKHEFPGLRAVIVGDGEQRAELERMADALGLAGIVSFLGFRADIPDLLTVFDVAVSSSTFEGSPLAILEYMEAGKPVVATRVGGVPDLIEDGEGGVLVEPRDPDALAQAIAGLLRDPERRAELGRRSQERRRREFDIETTVRRLEELYEELYESPRRVRRLRG